MNLLLTLKTAPELETGENGLLQPDYFTKFLKADPKIK